MENCLTRPAGVHPRDVLTARATGPVPRVSRADLQTRHGEPKANNRKTNRTPNCLIRKPNTVAAPSQAGAALVAADEMLTDPTAVRPQTEGQDESRESNSQRRGTS